ncbi:MAG: FecR family protein, partial [Thermodesulfobacteriota bacterium]
MKINNLNSIYKINSIVGIAGLLALALLIVLAPYGVSFAYAGTAGTITALNGRADVIKPKTARGVPLEVGSVIEVGDVLRTKSESKVEITFIDDSVMRIAPRTKIRIEEYLFDGNKREAGVVKLFRGKARAIVSRASNGSSIGKFEVHTPTAVAGVRGTDFVVFHSLNLSGVLVTLGLVEVYNPEMPDVSDFVEPGFVTIVKSGDIPHSRVATDAETSQHIRDTTINGGGDGSGDGYGEDGDGDGEGGEGSSGGDGTSGVDIPFTDVIGIDSESPIISLKGPKSLTNSSDANFEVVVEDESQTTLSYFLDGVQVAESSLTGLSEGGHTFTVTVTDSSGNSSAATYNWTTDYTPPDVIISGVPNRVTSSDSAGFVVSSSEPVTYSYSLDDSAVGGSALSGLSEGVHTFRATVTDEAGNTATVGHNWMVGDQDSTFIGSATGTGSHFSSDSVEGNLVSIEGETWGAWIMDISGDYTGPSSSAWNITAGGIGYEANTNTLEGYWIDRMAGVYSGTEMSGESNLFYLTETTLGVGSGTVSGAYDAATG